MFSRISASYDLNNTLLSWGIHHRWKRLLVRRLRLQSGARVLDLCTGTGDLLTLLAGQGQVVGVDFCREMLVLASRKAACSSAVLLQADALRLPFADASFDAVTVAFGLRNLEQLEAGLAEVRRVLEPGGRFCALEFGQPPGRLMGFCFGLYSRWLLPCLGGLVSGDRDAYSYLHLSMQRFPCGPALERLLERHGLLPDGTEALSGGIAYLYSAVAA